MQFRRKSFLTTVRTEGSILPPDLLQRVLEGDRGLGGLDPDDYHLGKGERLNEATNHSWNRLLGIWASFKPGLEKLPASDLATNHTRERWLLILFQELGYGRLQSAKSVDIKGKSYPISHFWQQTPIHLVSCRVDLGSRSAGVAGAARTSPHSLVQELLNRSNDHLWAFVSNGFILRILRDNVSLTRQAYVEFDLQAMMDGEVYADFALLWLLCHQSRVEAERPADCWLEKWSRTAQDQGTRALDQLRKGVEDAINILGRGFLSHQANRLLRDKLYSGELETQDYYRQILRLVYRLIFLFVAEDRELLLVPKAPAAAQDRYIRFYSTARIRRLAERRRGTKHTDLFQGIKVIMGKLDSSGCPELGLPALGSFLWSAKAVPDLTDSEITNSDLLDAVRALAFTTDGHTRRVVDYKNMGSEELGSVYESLLELYPVLDTGSGRFELKTTSGSERKTTGSYYTPSSLINCLLDSALDPVLDEAAKQKDPESAILSLKICDPACGSGHFLISAAHRMAKRLAAVKTGDEEPAPEVYRTTLREVIGRCIYGVDVNEMAVELCKVSLWMEAMEPGKPLSFLDHRILCGNSLLGATPALLAKGIPDEAFKPIEGDQKELCREFKRKNKEERDGQVTLLFDDMGVAWPEMAELSQCLVELGGMKDDTITDINRKEKRYLKCVNSSAYRYGRLLADAWCAAFVWKKTKEFPYPITEGVFRNIEDNPKRVPSWMLEEIYRLADQYQFFHWHLAFPDVFKLPGLSKRPGNEQTGWSGGFDVVLGNPPWDTLEINLDGSMSVLQIDVIRRFQHWLLNSATLPLTASGRKNLYALFVEQNLKIKSSKGSIGTIVPTGIVQDKPNEELAFYIFKNLLVKSVYDFENRGFWFPSVDNRQRFCLLNLNNNNNNLTHFIFDAIDVTDILDSNRTFYLTLKEIQSFCLSSFKVPMFRNKIDANISKKAYYCGVHLENICDKNILKSTLMFNFGSVEKDKKRNLLEIDQGNNNWFRIYEGEYIHAFNHRFATFNFNKVVKSNTNQLSDPFYTPITATFLPCNFVHQRYLKLCGEIRKYWLVLRRQARHSDEFISISTIVPEVAIEGSMTVFYTIEQDAQLIGLLCSNFNSFIFNYLVSLRQSGPNVNKSVYQQIPVIDLTYSSKNTWENAKHINLWFKERYLELIYTSWDLVHFAIDCGYIGSPFYWNEARRFLIRCELNAAFFHLYGIERDDVDYIMETFPIVKRKDEASYGYYRTKDVILEIYDQMTLVSSKNAGKEATACYQTPLNPSPGPPMDAEGNFISMYYWERNNWPAHIHAPHPEWEESLLTTWFAVCQRRSSYMEDDQIFPWDGRESFVYALIPYLVQERPGELFEFYRDAALLASHSNHCETLLLNQEIRDEYRQIMNGIDWLDFPDEYRIRPRKIREKLQDKRFVHTDPRSGATVVQNEDNLPPLPKELKPLLPMILKAADNLNEIQRHALGDAKAAKVDSAQSRVTNELRNLMVV